MRYLAISHPPFLTTHRLARERLPHPLRYSTTPSRSLILRFWKEGRAYPAPPLP